jgi:hypothetical protein
MKPSIKNKFTADKIEQANRELNEKKPTIVEVESPVIEPKIAPNTEGVGVLRRDKVKKIPAVPVVVKKTSRRSKIAVQAEEENLRLVRVTIDIPEDLHEKMKIKMILTKQTMKDYLLDFIRSDVGNSNFGYK